MMTDQPYKPYSPRVQRLVDEHKAKTEAIAEAEAARSTIEQDLAAEAFGLKAKATIRDKSTGKNKRVIAARAVEGNPGVLGVTIQLRQSTGGGKYNTFWTFNGRYMTADEFAERYEVIQ